jgi:hypothetical protein
MAAVTHRLRVDQDGLFTNDEHAVLSDWFGQQAPAAAAHVELEDALAQLGFGVMSKPLTPQELAAARIRGARYRARRRGSQLIRWDGRVGYDGVVLGMLVLRGYLTEADTADPAKVNAALTQVLFYEAYQEAPERIPRCFVRVEDRFDQCERLRRGRLFVGLFLVTWHSDPFALGSPKTLLQPCRGYGVNAPAGGRCHRAVRPGLFHRRSL